MGIPKPPKLSILSILAGEKPAPNMGALTLDYFSQTDQELEVWQPLRVWKHWASAGPNTFLLQWTRRGWNHWLWSCEVVWLLGLEPGVHHAASFWFGFRPIINFLMAHGPMVGMLLKLRRWDSWRVVRSLVPSRGNSKAERWRKKEMG